MTLVLPMTQYHYHCDYPTSLAVEDTSSGEYTWEAGRITARPLTPLEPISENIEIKSGSENLIASKDSDLTPTKPMTISKCQTGIKRKLEYQDIGDWPKPKRPSILNNTPKQRREEKRKILKMSVHKLRNIDDPETVLHKAVLINNTMKRMQREIREEKQNNVSPRKRFQYEENTSPVPEYLSQPSCMYQEKPNETEKSVEKMTDVRDVSERLVDSVQCNDINPDRSDVEYCPYSCQDISGNHSTETFSINIIHTDINDENTLDQQAIKRTDTVTENKVFGEMDTVFNSILCSLES
ncbi:unnamed protein product [Owenia fusiformis]|uniref:SERTA domain-containing protein n=1 Tax=Owenia fusiformis TaxID=6347 RepID=A0A8S4PBN2_OWEFU|nr:unnamed protein product [Owenia fusiformis]